MVSVIRTSIFVDDERDFRNFLESEGFNNFHLFPSSSSSVYLNIHFENNASLFTYKLRDVESEYKDMHSNTYYYDLDQSFDNEAAEFFGDDDDY